jgi:hypothetical protein
LISEHRLPDLLVQDQHIHIAEELEPLEEFNSPEHIRKLTQLHSQLAAKSTHDQKGHYDLNSELFCTIVDSIFDSLPHLLQLPDSFETSSILLHQE